MSILVVRIFVIGAVVAGSSFSRHHEVPQGRPESYLDAVIEQSKGAENQFFQAQQPSPDMKLLDSLGIVQRRSVKPLGTIRYRGKEVEPLYTDEGWARAINDRKKLAWSGALMTTGGERKVLIFERSFEVHLNCLTQFTGTTRL